MTSKRLDAIRRLAEQGVGGEKENAQRILERLGGVGQASEKQAPIKTHAFDFYNGIDLMLYNQIVLKYYPKRKAGIGKQPGTFVVECTDDEASRIHLLFSNGVRSFTLMLSPHIINALRFV